MAKKKTLYQMGKTKKQAHKNAIKKARIKYGMSK